MLESLLEMEVAYSLLREAKGGEAGVHPLDSHYNKLNSDIEVLDRTSKEFSIIQQYVDNTHAATHTSYKLQIEEVIKLLVSYIFY